MGLDMYLSESTYLSHWPHSKGTEEYGKAVAVLEALDSVHPIYANGAGVEVKFPIAYWRKANQVHAWFVQNVQDGVDQCQPSELGVEDLEKLRDACKLALSTEDPTILPPESGFFFGSTEIGEWYWADLRDTVTQLDAIIERAVDGSWFVYQASW